MQLRKKFFYALNTNMTTTYVCEQRMNTPTINIKGVKLFVCICFH